MGRDGERNSKNELCILVPNVTTIEEFMGKCTAFDMSMFQ